MTVAVTIYQSLSEAEPFLRALAIYTGPWVFDIETYDGVEFPSRKEVSVNPHHPDFRVRGCAFALSPDEGVWVEMGGVPSLADPIALAALAAAFASDAEKGAFNGGFDENGIVYTGWVPRVANRTRDGMLAMVALGDGTHNRLTLRHGVETLLGATMAWDDADKSLMRDLPIEQVARGAVGDACSTFALCDFLDSRADADDLIEWRKTGQRSYEDERPKKIAKEKGGGVGEEVGGGPPAAPEDPDFRVEW